MLSKLKDNIILIRISFVIGIIALLFGICGFIENNIVNELCKAIGVSIVTSSFIYYLIYKSEYKKEFYIQIAEIIGELSLVTDYLTDFLYDTYKLKDMNIQYKLILDLYCKIHSIQWHGSTSLTVKLHGKNKMTMKEVYEDVYKSEMNLLAYMVQLRECVVRKLYWKEKNVEIDLKKIYADLENYNSELLRCKDRERFKFCVNAKN